MKSHRRHLSPAQSAGIVIKHSDMLKHGSNQYEEKVEVSRDTSIKSETDVAKEVGVGVKILTPLQLNLKV